MDRALIVDGHRSMYCMYMGIWYVGRRERWKPACSSHPWMAGWVGEVDVNGAFAQLQSLCVGIIPVSSFL